MPINNIRAIQLPFVDRSEKGQIPDGFEEIFPLTVEECEGLSARNSAIGAVLDTESRLNSPCQPCSQVDPCVRDSMNAIISANSMYQRNLSAEQAMLAYFGLAEVYLQNQIIDETLVEIEELQEVLEQLQEEGLLRDVDPESLNRKRLEALEMRNELLFNFESLNEALRGLLGLERDVHPIWTDCQISNWEVPVHLDAELEIAFSNRTDVQSLEKLSSISNDQIIETLRNSVRSASPLAGLVLERRIFGGYFSDQSAEVAKLRSQLLILHNAQIDLVKSQVAEHFYSVLKNHEMIQLKRQKLASLRKSEARLDAKRQVGPIEVDEVLSVKSELLKCRSEIIRSAIELQMSWIRLRSAQGLLGRNDLAPNTLDPSKRTGNSQDGQLVPQMQRNDQGIEQISTASADFNLTRQEKVAAALNGPEFRNQALSERTGEFQHGNFEYGHYDFGQTMPGISGSMEPSATPKSKMTRKERVAAALNGTANR